MRVNIEQDAWTDLRFVKLSLLLKKPIGCAIGLMAHVWYLGQLNQSDTFEGSALNKMIGVKNFCEKAFEAGLLEQVNGQFRVKGLAKRLNELDEFYEKKRNAGRLGGIKSGQTRSKNEADASQVLKQKPSNASDLLEANAKQNEASMSWSMSMSKSMSKEPIQEKENTPETSVPGDVLFPDAELVEAEVVESKPKTLRKKKAPEFDEADLALGTDWLAWAREGLPTINATPASFAGALSDVRRRLNTQAGAGINHDGLRQIFEFVKADKFWSKNCLSPAGLLSKGSNGLRKVENIMASMTKLDDKSRQNTKFWKDLDAGIEPEDLADLDWLKPKQRSR